MIEFDNHALGSQAQNNIKKITPGELASLDLTHLSQARRIYHAFKGRLKTRAVWKELKINDVFLGSGNFEGRDVIFISLRLLENAGCHCVFNTITKRYYFFQEGRYKYELKFKKSFFSDKGA